MRLANVPYCFHSEVAEPHGFAVRCNVGHLARRARSRITALQTRFAPDAACVHRIPSRVRDDARSAPLSGRDGAEIATDLGRMESGIFLREGLDRFLVICPSG